MEERIILYLDTLGLETTDPAERVHAYFQIQKNALSSASNSSTQSERDI